MVVVTDGESHDYDKRERVIAECQKKGITRFGIAVRDLFICLANHLVSWELRIYEYTYAVQLPLLMHFCEFSNRYF